MSIGLSLLAKVLSEERIQDFSKLEATWFIQHEAKAFRFVRQYVDDYGSLPTLALASEKTEIPAKPSKDAFGYWHDEFVKRGVHLMLSDLPEALKKMLNDKDPLRALAEIKQRAVTLDTMKMGVKRDVVNLVDLAGDVWEHIYSARMVQGLTGISSGWPYLDRQTGGFQNGDTVVVVARVKKGKSQCMGFMANSAYDLGHIPLFISMEMSDIQIARRMYAMRAGVAMRAVKTGQISHWGEEKLRRAVEVMGSKHPFYLVQGQFKKDVDEISSLIYGLKPAAVYIDGGYLVKLPGAKSWNMARWERMTEVIERLKTVAVTADVPMIVSFQFNRQVKAGGKSGGMEDIQLADAIGQVASTAIGLFDGDNEPDDPNMPQAREEDRYKTIKILGGREGEAGEFRIRWNWSSMNFTEIENETEATHVHWDGAEG